MENLQSLIANNQHEKIIALEGEEYRKYKCIANIQIENYKKGLELADPNSFEECYCLYKLRNFKKCIRKINRIKNKENKEAFDVLLAQALYFQGYYGESYEILKKYPSAAACINLRATESLIKASISENTHRFKVSNKGNKECKFISYNEKFTDEEKKEFEYNASFEKLISEEEFIKELERTNNLHCRNQLNNIIGNFNDINRNELTKRQIEIVEHNLNKTEIDNLMHFQDNNYEFNVIKDLKNEKNKKDFKFDIKSDKLRALSVFLDFNMKKKIKGEKIEKIQNEKFKLIFGFLNGKEKSEKELKKVLSILKK